MSKFRSGKQFSMRVDFGHDAFATLMPRDHACEFTVNHLGDLVTVEGRKA